MSPGWEQMFPFTIEVTHTHHSSATWTVLLYPEVNESIRSCNVYTSKTIAMSPGWEQMYPFTIEVTSMHTTCTLHIRCMECTFFYKAAVDSSYSTLPNNLVFLKCLLLGIAQTSLVSTTQYMYIHVH